MKHGFLTEHFVGIGAKTLSAVEASPDASNQHELNGVTRFQEILGTDRREFPAHLIYLSDDEDIPIEGDTRLTWYDARERHPTRSEWRLYYPATPVSEAAEAGDLIVLGRRSDDSLLVVIAPAGSTAANQVLWLFGLGDEWRTGATVRSELESDRDRLDFASRAILESLGIEDDVDSEGETFLDQMLTQFGDRFPPTKTFSAFARDTLPDVDPVADPDAALITWLAREEELFRAFEKHLVAERLEQGFARDVDGFIAYSLSVQNRRKSRAGHALENHFEVVLSRHRIVHERNGLTERQSRPDFLFPNSRYYHDLTVDPGFLTVLGAKSTCKDRWRQVLAEANRAMEKYLLTLEPRISVNQTDEMAAQRLHLVLPSALHTTFLPVQQLTLLTVRDFLQLVNTRQRALGI